MNNPTSQSEIEAKAALVCTDGLDGWTVLDNWRGEMMKAKLPAKPEPIHEPNAKCNGRVKYASASWRGRPVNSPLIKVHCGCSWRYV